VRCWCGRSFENGTYAKSLSATWKTQGPSDRPALARGSTLWMTICFLESRFLRVDLRVNFYEMDFARRILREFLVHAIIGRDSWC
jgi:hypothetical protein